MDTDASTVYGIDRRYKETVILAPLEDDDDL
jgi:hypothetical protein